MADIFDNIALKEPKDIFDEIETPKAVQATGDIFDEVELSDVQRFGQAQAIDPTVGAIQERPVFPDQTAAIRPPVRAEVSPEEVQAIETSTSTGAVGEFAGGVAKGLSPKQTGTAFAKSVGGLVRMFEEVDFNENPALAEYTAAKRAEGKDDFVFKIPEIGKEVADYWDKEQKRITPQLEPESPEAFGFGAGRSVGTNIPYLLAGAFTRSPGVALGGLSAQVTGETFQDFREAGVSVEDARLAAPAYGAAEAIGEAFTVKALLNPAFGFTKRMLLSTLVDIPGELVTDTIQAGIDTQTIDPDMTFNEFKQRLKNTGIQTALTGPLMAGAVHPIVSAVNRGTIPKGKEITEEDAGQAKAEILDSPELTDEVKEELIASVDDIPNAQAEQVKEQKRLQSKTFKPLEISETPLPETTAGILPSQAEKGGYFHTTAKGLNTHIKRHGDGFLYRATRHISLSEGKDMGDPDYKHRFKDKLKKAYSFTTSLDDALNFVDSQSKKDYIIYRVLPEDLSNDFTAQVPSFEGRGETLHIQSPLPARTNLTDVVYRNGQLEGRSEDDSRRAIEERRVEGRQRGSGEQEGLRTAIGREGGSATQGPIPTEPTQEGLAPSFIPSEGTETIQESGDIFDDISPDFARSVNLEKLNISEKAKEVARTVGALEEKQVQTWDQTGEISKEIQKDYKKVQKIVEKGKNREGLNTAETDVIRQVNTNAINTLTGIANQDISIEEFNEALKQYNDQLFSAMSNASSEAGRTLNIHKNEVSPQRVAKALDKLDRGLNERELKEFKEIDWDNPITAKRFVERLGDPKLKDYFFEFWYNSILSGPPTHVVNTISNTLWTAFQVPHRALTGTLDASISKLTGKEREVFFSEIFPMMAGYKTGWFKGLEGAKETVRTNQISRYESKFDREIGGPSSSAFERSPYAPLRKIAPGVSMPTRFLRAADVWTNSIAYDGQMRALAKRETLKKGYTGNKAQAFEKMFLTNTPQWAKEEASRHARYSTFMDDPGKFTQGILTAREAPVIGPLLRVSVMPFVNTISNLTKRGVEMTPGLGLTLSKGQPISEVVAKQIEGAIITMLIMGMIEDDKITGKLPDNKAEREAFYRQGKQPWSIKVGDTWYSYRRFEPFNLPVATVVSAYEAITNAEDEDTKTDIFMNTANSIKENVLDGSYLSGVSTLFERQGRSKSEALPRFASTLVPYSSFFRSINRAYEAGTEGSAKVRDHSGYMSSLAQVIPGISHLSQPRLNVWGEEVDFQGGVLRQWLPYKWSKEVTDDALETELERLNIYPSMPGGRVKVNGKLQTIPDAMYRDYLISIGSDIKKHLDGHVETQGYRSAPDHLKVKQVKRIISKFRAAKLKELKSRMTQERAKNAR